MENKNELILVIEDEEDVRAEIVSLLNAAGFRVVEARNGKNGMAQMKQHGDVSLVVTDILMPEMDGLEVVMEVRKYYPTKKIIAISKVWEYLSVASTLGAHATVAKPFPASALLDAIRHANLAKTSHEPAKPGAWTSLFAPTLTPPLKLLLPPLRLPSASGTK